jgi:hypothetical protein
MTLRDIHEGENDKENDRWDGFYGKTYVLFFDNWNAAGHPIAPRIIH